MYRVGRGDELCCVRRRDGGERGEIRRGAALRLALIVLEDEQVISKDIGR